MVQSWALPSRLGFFQPGRHTSTVRGRELAGTGTVAAWSDSKAQGAPSELLAGMTTTRNAAGSDFLKTVVNTKAGLLAGLRVLRQKRKSMASA